ncbi:hypothetical protein INR49_024962 [Caranx melampygus]|nr:hypothetical protein INR49_024962 [Caranx melampygus]
MSFRDLKPLYIELRSGNADKRPWTKFQHTSIIPKTQRLVLAELDFLWYSEGRGRGGGGGNLATMAPVMEGLCVCLCVFVRLHQSSEAQFFSSRGLAKSKMSKLGSSDLPRPSSTMMANTMEAKLLSSFTYKKGNNIRKRQHQWSFSLHSFQSHHCCEDSLEVGKVVVTEMCHDAGIQQHQLERTRVRPDTDNHRIPQVSEGGLTLGLPCYTGTVLGTSKGPLTLDQNVARMEVPVDKIVHKDLEDRWISKEKVHLIIQVNGQMCSEQGVYTHPGYSLLHFLGNLRAQVTEPFESREAVQKPTACFHQQQIYFHLPPDAWMHHLKYTTIYKHLLQDTDLDSHRYQTFPLCAALLMLTSWVASLLTALLLTTAPPELPEGADHASKSRDLPGFKQVFSLHLLHQRLEGWVLHLICPCPTSVHLSHTSRTHRLLAVKD